MLVVGHRRPVNPHCLNHGSARRFMQPFIKGGVCIETRPHGVCLAAKMFWPALNTA
jgi:hypothetical protein